MLKLYLVITLIFVGLVIGAYFHMSKSRVEAIMEGIAYVESYGAKNPYTLKSLPSKNGDRAYGKWQIMGNNIPSWTKEALGKSLTIQQFVESPELQKSTVKFQITRHINASYSDSDIASIWFSGRPMKKAGNAKDVYGTTVPMYVKRFLVGVQKYYAE